MKPIQVKIDGKWKNVPIHIFYIGDVKNKAMEIKPKDENETWRFEPEDHSCANCCAFHKDSQRCHRHAPRDRSEWPQVHPSQWCCEFLEKDT